MFIWNSAPVVANVMAQSIRNNNKKEKQKLCQHDLEEIRQLKKFQKTIDKQKIK